MVRFAGLASLCLAATLFSGCGEDRREAPIQNVINALNLSVENVKAINTRLTEAAKLKKELDEAAEAGKKEAKNNLDTKLKDVDTAISDLKVQAKKLLNEMRSVEANPLARTDEEKKALATKYQGRVVEAMKQLSAERLELANTWKEVRTNKVFETKVYNDLDQKFKDAEGEFENLARLK